jgi:hypothetical protein
MKTKLHIFFTIVFIVLLSASCESKSGQLSKIPFEKVVIIDSTPDNASYKVKRIEKGVVTFITYTKGYECGDTILYRFIN